MKHLKIAFSLLVVAVLIGLAMAPAQGHVTKKFGHLWNNHLKPRLAAAGTINDPANPIDWTRLKNVPASIADGDDEVGVSGVEMVSSQSDFSSSPYTSHSVSCPSGKIPVGGGASTSNTNAVLTWTRPNSFGWEALAVENPSTTSSWVLVVYVICATG